MGKGTRNRKIRQAALEVKATAAPRTAHKTVRSIARQLRRCK